MTSMVSRRASFKTILIGVCCIDRDAHLIPNLLKIIKSINIPHTRIDVACATRKTDKNTIKLFRGNKIITINHYNIEGRHNTSQIAIKRNKLLAHAKNNKYDFFLFLDADILPYDGFLQDLINLDADVAVGLYAVRWLDNKPYCMTTNGLKVLAELSESDTIIVAGFGCCLIKPHLYDIPVCDLKITDGDIKLDGEDFGWFFSIRKIGAKVLALKREITHII